MKTSTKILLTAAFVSTIGLAGLVRAIYASQSQSAVVIIPQHRTSTQVAQREAASDGNGEVDDDAQEQQEAAQLQALAKITPQQAKQAAEAAQGGTASSVELENEDGNLVYEVTIGQTDVIVDAGNAKVLYTENANQEDDAVIEATRPRSSIQLPNTDKEQNEVNDNGHPQ